MEWVYFLAEDESSTANLIFPVAVERHGKMIWDELESIVGGYAISAACALERKDADYAEMWVNSAPSHFFLPADRLARKATVVGVPRLRHRARTSNTSRWRLELAESAEGWIAAFRGIIAENAPDLLDAPDQRLADFKGASTVTSNLVQGDINDSFQSPIHTPSPVGGEDANAFSRPSSRDVDAGAIRALMPDRLLDRDQQLGTDRARYRA